MILQNIDWADLDAACLETAQKIKDAAPSASFEYSSSAFLPDCIIAIAKGGLVPARIIARHLKIERIYCVGAKAYSGMDSLEELKVYQGLPMLNSTNMLIVDDISDRGNTLTDIKSLCVGVCSMGANIMTAAPYYKTGTMHIPDFSATEFPRDNWIVFPWEDPPEDI